MIAPQPPVGLAVEARRVLAAVHTCEPVALIRNALTALKGPLGNRPAFKKQMQKLLDDEGSRQKLMSELGIDKKDGNE